MAALPASNCRHAVLPRILLRSSTFSAVAAEILKTFTGSDTFGASVLIKSGSSLIEPGVVPATDLTLSWPTFSAAAGQAGLSRRYGGIHFQTGDLMGRALDFNKAWRPCRCLATKKEVINR
ncbi:MAG: hypothetical protein H0U76_27140 [Ktedonobacteraceae bacterium]|nr:hypothetical protein [Ktedonobacteraceae bacterium]